MTSIDAPSGYKPRPNLRQYLEVLKRMTPAERLL